MTTFGFIPPHPKGHCFSEMDGKNEKWFQIFDKNMAPKRSFVESGKIFATKPLMGASMNDTMDAQGKLSCALSRPMPSHIDVIRFVWIHACKSLAAVVVPCTCACAFPVGVSGNAMLPAPRDPCATRRMNQPPKVILMMVYFIIFRSSTSNNINNTFSSECHICNCNSNKCNIRT